MTPKRRTEDVIGPFALRPMVYEDLTLVWHWRNHDSIRAQSQDSQRIPWLSHASWFDSTTYGPKYIFTEAGRSVGVVTLNHLDEWSFYLDPTLPRNKGYGCIMLSLAVAHLKTFRSAIFATVLKSNPASKRLHQRLGFVRVGQTKTVYRYQLKFT
jgi:RimJ/RimL family protein N-acetyltransferase